MHVQYMRFVIAVIATFGAFAIYVSRMNLSIAIIDMVDADNTNTRITTEWSNSSDNIQTSDANLLPSKTVITTTTVYDNHLDSTLEPNGASTVSPTIKNKEIPMIAQTKFKWDQNDQGKILGAFFYGYILLQIPGARIAETLGARWIIIAATMGSAFVSLTFPMATEFNSIYLLMMLRFVMGLCQSAYFPATYVLFCRWLPERERSVLLPIMFTGSNVGSISTYAVSSYLIDILGWPSVFYVSGIICLVVSILWCIFGSSEPSHSMFISDKERIYIEKQIDNQSSNNLSTNDISLVLVQKEKQHPHNNNTIHYYPKQDINNNIANDNNNNNNNNKQVKLLTTNLIKSQSCLLTTSKEQRQDKLTTTKNDSANSEVRCQSRRSSVTPEPSWSKLIQSVPVWTLIFSMYGNEWSIVVLGIMLPTYLKNALNYGIKGTGYISSLFQLAYVVASPIMSALSTYILERHLCGMKKIHLRKTFQSLATFGQLFCFLSVTKCRNNSDVILVLMFLSIIFRSCSNAGDIMVAGDLSPDYAGTIYAFANSVGNTAGFFAPLLVGVFVDSTAQDRNQWAPFWIITSVILGCSGVIFLVFGEVEPQDFDKTPKKALEPTDITNHNNDKGNNTLESKKNNKFIT